MSKSAQVTLPDKLSDLAELALNDLEKCEAMPEVYEIRMSAWHKPGVGKCLVCAAGAVMAQTLRVPHFLEKSPGFFDRDTRLKLLAINSLRLGDLHHALRALDGGWRSVLALADGGCMHITHYSEDPIAFKRDMRAMIDYLRSRGL